MATVNAQKLQAYSARTRRMLFEAMAGSDVGSPQLVGERPDGSIQVVGTFDSATVAIQGSNDGTNWFDLTDETGTVIAITAAGGKMFLPRVWKIRPEVSGGGGSCDLDVYIVLGS